MLWVPGTNPTPYTRRSRIMEALLNTIWLLVTLGAFACWRPGRTCAFRRSRRNINLLTVFALACALVLLFPVISLTDDLHAEQFPMEDSAHAAKKARDLERGCLSAGSSSFAAASATVHSASALRRVLGIVIPLEIAPFCLTLTYSPHGRSPPCNN